MKVLINTHVIVGINLSRPSNWAVKVLGGMVTPMLYSKG